jgi:HTH-type transcriptional regulator/antitoxin MqsA
MRRFDDEVFTVSHAGRGEEIAGLAGWRCSDCGEAEFEPESARRYADAGDRLVLQARTQRQRDLRRIRRKLGLTQRQAARLTGGGHNAFSRYERGEAEPMPAVVHLLHLLDRHPELLSELSVEDPGADGAGCTDRESSRPRRPPSS